MTFPLELNGNPGKHNEMLVRTSPKKIPTADMLTSGRTRGGGSSGTLPVAVRGGRSARYASTWPASSCWASNGGTNGARAASASAAGGGSAGLAGAAFPGGAAAAAAGAVAAATILCGGAAAGAEFGAHMMR